MNRPKTDLFSNMLYPKYMSCYNHTCHRNVPKYALSTMADTLDNKLFTREEKVSYPGHIS